MEGRVRAPAQGPFCRDPGDPGMGSFFRVLGMKNNENGSDLTPVQCFFYFFIPLSSKTPIFESFLEFVYRGNSKGQIMFLFLIV